MAQDPIQGLIDYVNEVKPFHTKILEVAVAYAQNDDVDITITEDLELDVAMFWPAVVGSPDEGPIRVCSTGYGVLYDRQTPYIIVNANGSPQTISLEGNHADAFPVGMCIEVREPYQEDVFGSPLGSPQVNTPRIATMVITSVTYDSDVNTTVLGVIVKSESWLGSPIYWVGSPALPSPVRDGILAVHEQADPYLYYSNNGATTWNTDAVSIAGMGSPRVGPVVAVNWMDNIERWTLVARRTSNSELVVWTTADADPNESSVWNKVFDSAAGFRADGGLYAGGRLVLTAGTGQMWYTDDLSTFTNTTWASGNVGGPIAHGLMPGSPAAGFWVTGGGNGDGAYSLNNGVTWTQYAATPGGGVTVGDIECGDVEGGSLVPRVIVSGQSAGVTNQMFTCDDINDGAPTWTARTITNNTGMAALGRNWNTGTLFVNNTQGFGLRSTDNGTTWLNAEGIVDTVAGSPIVSRFTWPGGGVANDIKFDNASNQWIAVGEQSSYPAIWVSDDDALTWTQVFDDGSPRQIGGIFRVGIKAASNASYVPPYTGSPFFGSPNQPPAGSPPFSGTEFWFPPYGENVSGGDVFSVYDVVETSTLNIITRPVEYYGSPGILVASPHTPIWPPFEGSPFPGSPKGFTGSPATYPNFGSPESSGNTITIKSTTPDVFLYGQEIEIRNATNTDINKAYNIFEATDLGGSPNLVQLTVLDAVLADTTNDGELVFTPDGFSGGDICGDVPPEILQTHWFEDLNMDWRFEESPLDENFQHFILEADSTNNTYKVEGDARYLLTFGSPQYYTGSPQELRVTIQHAVSAYGSPYSPELSANNGGAVISAITYDADTNRSTLTMDSVTANTPTGWVTRNTAEDEFLGNVVLLISAENASDGDTVFTPDIGTDTFTAFASGGAGSPRTQISSRQAKYGSNSVFGHDDAGAPSHYWSAAVNNTDFDFGADDFTIEFDVFMTEALSSNIIMAKNIFGNYSWRFSINMINMPGDMRFTFVGSTDGTTLDIDGAQRGMIPMTLNEWHTFSISRQNLGSPSGRIHFHADGQYLSSYDATGETFFTGNDPLHFFGEAGAGTGFHQTYLDNIRITKGVGRYGNANYTLPTGPYPS